MKKIWTAEDLATDWLILPGDQQLIEKKRGTTRLRFTLLLKFFQLEGRFPSDHHEVPKDAVKTVEPSTSNHPLKDGSGAYSVPPCMSMRNAFAMKSTKVLTEQQ